MLGHGCERGLLQFSKLIIDKTFVPLLKEKSCVCIWCYADEFVNEHGLKGFYTGMFISELIETFANDIDSNWDDIRQSNSLFAEAVNKSIDTEKILTNVKKIYQMKGKNCEVMEFNRDRLYFNP
jgi:hypothetical protein